MGTMRFGFVSHLVACTRGQNELSPIGKLGMQLTFQAEQDMTFCTPMIRKVAWTIFHKPDTDVIKLLRPPQSHSCFPFVFGRADLRPDSCAKGDISHLHILSVSYSYIFTGTNSSDKQSAAFGENLIAAAVRIKSRCVISLNHERNEENPKTGGAGAVGPAPLFSGKPSQFCDSLNF
jgi:hypothetical protein